MAINAAFWNLGNLFDTVADPISDDLEFTPAQGWTPEVQSAKVTNLAAVIDLMFDGAGPNLLGVAEVENEATLQQLVDAVTVRNDLRIATFLDGPDIRGIDCALVYADTVFEVIDNHGVGPASHNVNNRYPTRDIFEVPLRLLANDAELIIMVNHWPSRRLGRFESEPLRIALANHCGRLVDNHLKYTRRELFELGDTAATMELLQQRWNRNILLMGDFNDEPSDRSIADELLAGRDLDRIEEALKPGAQRKTPAIPTYAAKKAPLFNCMWPLAAVPDRGTHYFAGSPSPFNVLDQFIVSRGLYYGLAGLRMTRAVTGVPDTTATPPTYTEVPIETVAADAFDPPIMWTSAATRRPKNLEFKLLNGQPTHNNGYSDHFPIITTIDTLP